MLCLKSVLSFATLLLAVAIASPAPGGYGGDGHRDCVSDDQADYLLHSFVSIFEKTDPKLANKIIADDFTQYSASTNFLLGKNWDAITFDNKADFIQGQVNFTAANPGKFIIKDTFHVCDKLVFYWQKVEVLPKIPEVGMDIIYFRKGKGGKFQIYYDVSEWNNAIDLYNAGLFPCPS